MWICVWLIYVGVCVHTCTYVTMHVYVGVDTIGPCMRIYTYISVYIYICRYVYVCVYVSICVYIHECIFGMQRLPPQTSHLIILDRLISPRYREGKHLDMATLFVRSNTELRELQSVRWPMCLGYTE